MAMTAQTGLRMFEWGDLHHSLQWIYRGPVAKGGRGFFRGGCGSAAWYLLAGEAVLRHDGHECRARKGDWLFPNAGPHERDFSADARILSLRFYIEWPNGQPLFDLGRATVLKGADHPDLRRRAEALEQVVYQRGKRNYADIEFMRERVDYPAYAEIGEALLAWSRALYRAHEAGGIGLNLERFQDERVVRALRVLDGWPLQRAFAMKSFMRATGSSRAQLDRLFTLGLGQTSRQYFDRRRLRHAERNLALPDRSIKEVSFAVGFQHVSSFSAWFKRNTGVYPNIWRKRRHSQLAAPNDATPRGSETRVRGRKGQASEAMPNRWAGGNSHQLTAGGKHERSYA
jgi:AraC-like DNA-binding protein